MFYSICVTFFFQRDDGKESDCVLCFLLFFGHQGTVAPLRYLGEISYYNTMRSQNISYSSERDQTRTL